MWFGSYNGLHKHEGTSIKVYNQSGKDSASLSSKEMHAVFEDRLGFIWVGTTGGLDKLDPKTGIILHFKLKPENKEDDRIGYIISIFQDDKDNIWVATDGGMFVINYTSGKFSQVLDNERSGKGMPNTGILYKGSVKTNTGIWMFASGYIIFYDFKSGQFFHQYNNPFHKKIFDLRAANNFSAQSELCADSANNLYFVFNNTTLVKYNLITEKLDSFHFASPQKSWACCYSLATDYKGNVWIGFRYGGLLLFDHNTHEFTTIRYDGVNSLIQSDYVYSLCEDYLKRMWVTTNNGIFVINYYDSTVQQKYLSDKSEFIDYESGIISQDQHGNIYVPFYFGGLFKYNVFNGNKQYFPVDDKAEGGYGYVFTAEKNKIIIGRKATFMQADTSLNTNNFCIPRERVYKLVSNYPGRVAWGFKHNDNAIYFKKTSGVIYYYNGTDSLETLISTGFSKQACVSKDSNYLYFLNYNADLVRRNLSTLETDTIFLNKKLKVLNFVYDNTRDIADDGNGNIWITSQNGLIKYNQASQNVFVYTTVNGLLHDFSFTLCADSKNRLWVGSMGGVNLYDPQKNTFINVFPESPDKLSNYFGSSLEAKDGHIYFLLGAKLVNIDPDGFFKQKIDERSLQLDEVRIEGNTINISTNALSDLTYKQNRIYFRFGLLEFAEPEKVQYYYWLEGLDKNWTDLGGHSEVTFNSLQPGNYTLHVRATDVYGNQVKEQLTIPFSIRPPFWKTWWFISLLIIFILVLIYSFIKWRENNSKAIDAEKLKVQQAKVEMYSMNEQLSKAKLEALRSQMNPHFIFNSLNAIQECILTNKVDAAYEYLSKFSKLQRMVLNNSEKELIPLSAEMEMLQLYLSLESLRFSKSFAYEINLAGITDADEIMIPSMITQPFVENAIWHGLRTKDGDKTLCISYEEKDGQVMTTVDDNGVGRERSAIIREQKLGSGQFDSKGTMLLQQRLYVLSQQFKAKIQFESIDKKDSSGAPSGTKIIISFPANLGISQAGVTSSNE